MEDARAATPVRILGDEYWIRGASAERVKELAAFVDAKFRDASSRGNGLDIKRLAVLVSLNLAEEVFHERELSVRGLEEYRRRVERCRLQVEAAIDNDDLPVEP
ncbi:MAG: cell division protein ZapA [Candidatus Eisenbacteria bacterium]|nr:cell division protein ZapA [Candidatus Eisenbacteria bacterium]MCC7141791.1 cell division protein ZapA [Candidatus Eisenbacteria bacterium]